MAPISAHPQTAALAKMVSAERNAAKRGEQVVTDVGMDAQGRTLAACVFPNGEFFIFRRTACCGSDATTVGDGIACRACYEPIETAYAAPCDVSDVVDRI
jgi:hypothetical protein